MSKNSFYGNFQDKFRKPRQKYFHSQWCSRPVRVKGIQAEAICILGLTMSVMTAVNLKRCLRLRGQARLAAGAIKTLQ